MLGFDTARRGVSRVGFAGAMGALFSVVSGVFLHNPIWGAGLINRSYDYPFGIRPRVPVDDVVMVYLDDKSHENLHQPYDGAWDRRLHAQLIDRLTEAEAKVIVYDIVFSGATDKEATEALAQAIKRNGKVVLACDWSIDADDPAAKQNRSRSVKPPDESLFEQEQDLGLDEMIPDQDFIVRRHFSVTPATEIASLSWTAAQRVGVPITEQPGAGLAQRYVNYYGPPEHLPAISFYQAIDRTNGPPDSYFRGKAVFVGARLTTYFSGQRKDEYRSPYSYWLSNERYFMPGVDIHAYQYLNLLRGDWLERFPDNTETSMILLSGVLFGFLLAQFRPIQATAVGIASAVAVTAIAYYMFKNAYLWIPWLLVVAVQIPAATAWSVVYNSLQLFVQKRLMENSVAMYVSPAVVKQIVRNPEMLKPGASKCELSVLFSDIANFTTMSEGMDPSDLARLMNNYFEGAVNNCIQATNGTVVKFIGDAIFAIWNAPVVQPDHRERACRAAILLRDKVTDFDFKKPGLEDLEVRTRIGLHCGEASVGNFGSSKRVDYTAFGENINLSSRMEGLNKYMGTSILATGDILKPVAHLFAARFLGRFVLKGFNKNVDVFELIDTADRAIASQPLRDQFDQALKKFHARDWDGAETAFREILEQYPKDGPAKFYLKHLPEIRAEPPAADWEGEVELKEK